MGFERRGESQGRTVLYYPHIRVADGPWLRHALLYWDKVASIVPDSLDASEGAPLSPETDALEAWGIFEPLHPAHALQDTRHELVEAMNAKVLRAVNSQEFATARGEPLSWQIHLDKFTLSLRGELESLGLAREGDDWAWMRVGHTVGLLYLSLLAKTLCFASGESMVPGTDETGYEDWLFPRTSEGEKLACLDIEFQRLLPVPSQSVSLDDIVRFRHENRTLLLRFRGELDRISMAFSACRSQHDVRDLMTTERENLELSLAELKEQLGSARIAGRLGNLKTLVGLAGAGALAAVSTPVGAVGAAVTVASSMREAPQAQDDILRSSPLAYVHQARDEGILL